MQLNTLDIQIYLGNIFNKCKDNNSIDWVEETLLSMVECLADETREEVEE